MKELDREKCFKIIYCLFWSNPDFEEAFSEDWRLVYSLLTHGKEDWIGNDILAMCVLYTKDWLKERGAED